ncbi:MAG: universal stress protein, partial [Limisphaerales bacterium]
ATHGFTGLKRFVLGSTTERVVRYAPCPVLVARNHRSRDEQGKLSGLAFKKILVPMDFSEFSDVAMNYASAFAREFDAERRFIHAVYPKYYFTGSEVDMVGYAKLLDELEGVAEKQMADFVKQGRFVGTKVSSVVERGHPVSVILDEAKASGSDLIIIPTHGRTGFKRAWLGSVAENVVRLAPCDVMVVRSRERDFI